MSKVRNLIVLACAVVVFSISGSSAGAELGIDRSNLTGQSEAVQEKTLQDIHDIHAIWFRDVLAAGKPEFQIKFVNEIKLAKQNKLKFLANVLPASSDYDNPSNQNAGQDFRNRCGWPQGSAKLSQINLRKLAQRLRAQLDMVKAAHLQIDAFEIGNEIDWICFNGDVPDGHAASEQELAVLVRGYAEFLKTAAVIIRDPHYFPDAKIITFGIAHGSDQWDKPPHHISNPARIIAMLRKTQGFNYLDNAEYHVDGYGTHIYPWSGDTAGGVTATMQQDAATIGRDKPYWVTEWGYQDMKAFPNRKGQSLRQGLEEFLATFDSLAAKVQLGPLMFYRYDVWLTDASGKLLPSATALSSYAAKQ